MELNDILEVRLSHFEPFKLNTYKMRTERQEVKQNYNKYCSSKGSEYDYFVSTGEELQSKTKITLRKGNPLYFSFCHLYTVTILCAHIFKKWPKFK